MDNAPNGFVPRPRFDYKPRSLLADYKYLALVFLLLLIAGALYLIKAPHKQMVIEPPPVYIEAIPAKQP